MTRSAVATDAFTYSDGNLATQSSGVWTNLDTAGSGDPQVVGNKVFGQFSGFSSPANRASGTYANDQYATILIVGITNTSPDIGIGVIARSTTDTGANRDFYYMEGRTDNTYVLGKIVNGSVTSLSSGSQTWAANDRVEIECEGTTIRGMMNSGATTIATVTDSSLASGRPGVIGRSAGSSGFGGGDDWEGGDITSAAGGPLSFGGALVHGALVRGGRLAA